MRSRDLHDGGGLDLTPEHRMLLRIRDTLYEGSWIDFVRDLRARLNDEPHVFDIVPASAALKTTIVGHLTLIDEMASYEQRAGVTLAADD
jgi:hypothetical protein